jgi:hypothetical protein
MRDWYYASVTVKLYYWFLVAVSLWAIARAAGLTRLLLAPFSSKLPLARLLDESTPVDTAVPVVLAGKIGEMTPPAIVSPVRLDTIDARVAHAAALSEASISMMRGMLWLTLILSVWTVVADALPAYGGETYGLGRSVPSEQALHLVAERLTTRLSIGLLVCAGLAVIGTFFENVLRRRRAAWQLVSANCRLNSVAPASGLEPRRPGP